MYTVIDFKTKKSLKEAVERGDEVEVYQPGPFPGKEDGDIAIEGPHGYHKWYANARIEDSIIVKGSVK
jgi:hypothetical protein